MAHWRERVCKGRWDERVPPRGRESSPRLGSPEQRHRAGCEQGLVGSYVFSLRPSGPGEDQAGAHCRKVPSGR